MQNVDGEVAPLLDVEAMKESLKELAIYTTLNQEQLITLDAAYIVLGNLHELYETERRHLYAHLASAERLSESKDGILTKLVAERQRAQGVEAQLSTILRELEALKKLSANQQGEL